LEGSRQAAPNSEAAVSEADLRAYHDRKRPMAVWSLGFAVLAALALWVWSPITAVALVTGTICGIANALLTMRGGERLLDHQSVSAFVISSTLRIVVFGIVPVEFVLHGPLWAMASYFVGFFTPLALYAMIVARAFRTG